MYWPNGFVLGSYSLRHPSVPPPLACAVSLKPQSCLICHSYLFMLVFPQCWHVTLCGIMIRVAGGCRAAVWIHFLPSHAHLDYQLELNWWIGSLSWWADFGRKSGDIWFLNIRGSAAWLSAQILKFWESFQQFTESLFIYLFRFFAFPVILFTVYICLINSCNSFSPLLELCSVLQR